MSYLDDLKAYGNFFRAAAKQYHIPTAALYGDCVLCRIFHGAKVSDYVGFSMFQMSGRERRKYVTGHRSNKLEKAFNTAPAEEKAQIGDKHQFNRVFAAYVRRDWLYAPDHTDEEIRSFLQRHAAIIVKPLSQSKGAGVHREETAELLQGNAEAFLQSARQEKLLLEELICQHPVLAAVNPSSVNTIRVCSARDRAGQVHIIGASLRGGGGGCVVDNLHADGVQYPVDVASGCILRGGVKHNGEKNILFHPSTGTKMIGLQIPHWDKILTTVQEAGKLLPNMRYIGWDIAVTEEGCEIIEANYGQGSNGMQQDGVGKYPVIKKYL